MTFLFIFAIAFGLAALATPLAGKLGVRLGLVAVPGGRRKHTGTIPVTGGVGLFAGFFLTALGLYFLGPLKSDHARPLMGVLVGAAFVFLVGLADDKYEFKPGPQLLAQIAAAFIAIATTAFIEQVTLPVKGFTDFFKEFGWAGRLLITYPLTIVWVVGMMNTTNLLDGLDGLAAGVGAIAAILFAIHSYSVWKQPDTPLYSLALAGACLGFLVFNFHPARAFLGSSGAMTLGFALATLSILTPARVATALLVMAIPIADAAFQLFDRWRRGQSPGQGDRGHLHYRLLDIGFSQRQIVLGYWAFCAVFGALALLISARIYKLIAMGVLGLMVVGVLVALNRKRKIQASNSKIQD
jgi:UDP-GlcNAc:undecaprenyl-phosphate GlcNAc-1-phosphate transferase